MSIEEIGSTLANAKRPIDVFGKCSDIELKKKYRSLAKKCHPDVAPAHLKSLAEHVTALLNETYERALKEIEEGIYEIVDEKELLKRREVLFEIKAKSSSFRFYEEMAVGDVAVSYLGLDENDNEIVLKYPLEESDNELIESEYTLLTTLDHVSIPKAIKKVKVNGRSCLIMPRVKGITLKELLENYKEIDGSHVSWILERLLSVAGYLHFNKIVHGNIKPENLIIDIDNHNVTLIDYSLAISDANESDSKYRIVNDDFTPPYVSSSSKVIPHADIYAIGKVAIMLMGGDIKNNAMPVSVDSRLRAFIRKLVNTRTNDAWALWDELIKLRTEIYGNSRFQKLELKRK